MRALTLWEPYASLVIMGAKPYEYRRWKAPRRFIGQRIIIHSAARKPKPSELRGLLDDRDRLFGSVNGEAVQQGIARDFLEKVLNGKIAPPLSAGLGTAVLGKPVKCLDLFRTIIDADDINPDMWAWPMLDPQPFAKPVPCRGRQGFWIWEPECEK